MKLSLVLLLAISTRCRQADGGQVESLGRLETRSYHSRFVLGGLRVGPSREDSVRGELERVRGSVCGEAAFAD